MNRAYYTLAVFHKCGERMVWTPEFGDYDREVVAQEMEDTRDDWDKGTKFRIVRTPCDNQASIDAAISKLNAN